MDEAEEIEYRNYLIEIWQAVHSKKWFYLLVQFDFCIETQVVAYDDKEQALTAARARVDFLILADSQ